MFGAIRLLQISDVHTMNKQGALNGVADITARLARIVEMVDAIDPVPDAVLMTGDLVDRTSTFDYSEVREFCQAIASKLDRPVLPLMGNHDDRVAFDAAMGELNAGQRHRHGDIHDHVRIVNGVRIVALDSTVPGRSYGLLDDHQLTWLREVLSVRARGGTLLTLHHPPALSPMPQLSYSGLYNAEALAEVIEGSDVRALITGHFHHACASMWHNIMVWTAPAVSYTQDVIVPTPRIRGVDRGAISLIDVSPTTISASVIDIPEADDTAVLDYDLDLETKRTQWEEVRPVAPI